ncbi:MAG TPA: lysylphosphatidylglycerol synthase transmembrane domain-containing protein [Rhodocyclaceae bacterium]
MSALLRGLASLALIALLLWLVGPARVLAAFTNANPSWLAAGFISAICATLLSALRWHALAQWLGLQASRLALGIAYWRGITANTLLPGAHIGGDTLRAVHLHRAGHSLVAAGASVLLDRLSGLWMLVVLSLGMTVLGQFGGALPADLLPLPPALTALLALAAVAGPLLLWQLSGAATARLPAKLAGLLGLLHQRPHPLGQYFAQMLWSAGVQGFSILAFACGARAVGIALPLWEFVIVAGPVFILAALPISVGGWGTREAAAALILGLFGVSRELAVAASILYGLYAAIQGLAGAITLLHSERPPASR